MAKVKKDNKITLFTKSKAPVDFILLVTVLILLATGIIMVLSASSPTALSESGNSYTYLYRQGFCAIIGILLMILLSKIDYRIYKKFYKIIYWGSIVILCLTFLFGASDNGATRWVYIGSISFQPSEVAKIGIILFYAELLTRKKDKLKNFKEGFFYTLLWLIPIVVIVFGFQNHFSATLVICFLAVFLMFMAGCKISHFILVGIPTIIGMAAIFLSKGGFRFSRIMSFANPGTDISGAEWQITQSLYAIGSGGIFGAGLGNSKQKYLYLPEPHNDFIFSVIAEELGFIGCAIILILFAIFIWRGIVIAMKSKDMFGSLVAIGITSLIAIEVIINVAVVTKLMPVTGMSLPFISYGGTALIIQLATVGILLNISKNNSQEEK